MNLFMTKEQFYAYDELCMKINYIHNVLDWDSPSESIVDWRKECLELVDKLVEKFVKL